MNTNNYDTNRFKYATTKSGYGAPRTVISDAPEQPRTKSKKDTKKWCKGVAGRDHKWAWVYRDILPNCHYRRDGATVEFQEKPLLTLEEERAQVKTGDWYIDRAVKLCLVCGKQRDWWTNAFELRRQGIQILTKLPE